MIINIIIIIALRYSSFFVFRPSPPQSPSNALSTTHGSNGRKILFRTWNNTWEIERYPRFVRWPIRIRVNRNLRRDSRVSPDTIPVQPANLMACECDVDVQFCRCRISEFQNGEPIKSLLQCQSFTFVGSALSVHRDARWRKKEKHFSHYITIIAFELCSLRSKKMFQVT